ncbi:MAG TPA: SAM-dependent methyltransferase [Acidimicrobiia bacterium]|nr:SAM-dependent methyltransferase [Acidimicrobiia bacterium]
MTPDATGEMEGHGAYDRHSLAQHSAGSFGMPLLERAIGEVVATDDGDRPVLVADLGAAGGRNELAPMSAAIAGLRNGGVRGAIVVVHTDIPTNDFTTLFETIEQSPDSYLHRPDVFAFAAGRSFYERIFPAASVTFGWSAIAVHWLSRVPVPVPDHVYCAFATGESREALARQSAADWEAFLVARAAELRAGGQVVVVGGAATDDGASGAEALMSALNDALRDAVADGNVTEAEYGHMTVPTWNRTLAEFAAPFAPDGAATEAGLALVEQSLVVLPDQYLPAYRASHDADAFADEVTGFLRAFTEPSLFETLDRLPDQRAAVASAVYADVHARVEADPESFETTWRVAPLRMVRR